MNIGYIRTSTDKQDLDKQKILLLEYAQREKMLINEFVELQISSGKSRDDRRINELILRLNSGDVILVTELSRLGRNMIEILNIIKEFSEKGIKIVFVRQPELSTLGIFGDLAIAFYAKMAEVEREYTRRRIKDALQILKDKGVKLGRKVGSKNKVRRLDAYKEEMQDLYEMEVPASVIRRIVNKRIKKSGGKPISYTPFIWYIKEYVIKKEEVSENTNRDNQCENPQG
jgi:DNA invertase Pin-like site-specific DNA recombinase